MDKAAFISRHNPTTKQIEMAKERGFELVPVGDWDAFLITPHDVMMMASWRGFRDFDAVCVVHPAAALNLISRYPVLVFENGNRAPEGEKPRFEPVALHYWAPKYD